MRLNTIKKIGKLNSLAFLLPLSLMALNNASHAAAKPATPKANVSISQGLTSVTFTVAQGKITVRLPGDIAAGDKISGAVEVEPNGKTDVEQDNNSGLLNNFALKFGGSKSLLATPIFRCIVPVSLAGSAGYLALLDRGGKEVARVGIAVQQPIPSSPAEDFILPRLGQAGKPVQIFGPFDGDMDNANVKIGGQDAILLAESPRELVFESPTNKTGSVGIQLKEGAAVAARSYRNVSVRLGVLTSDLRAGHVTTLSVGVAGLSGLQVTPIRVMVQNRTPKLVTLAGGDSQVINIQPADVPSSGALTFNFVLRSLVPGPFSVVAFLDAGQKE